MNFYDMLNSRISLFLSVLLFLAKMIMIVAPFQFVGIRFYFDFDLLHCLDIMLEFVVVDKTDFFICSCRLFEREQRI